MDNELNKKTINIMIVTFAFLGILCVVSGLIMPSFAMPDEHIINFSITQERIDLPEEEIIIRPRNLTKEINQPLSMDIRHYLYDADHLDENILNRLVLDTSSVNIDEAGVYTYLIILDEFIYTGTITIRERDLPRLDLTLRNLSFERGSTIPTDISKFIEEDLSAEILSLMNIDLSNVNPNIPAIYQYSITFNGRMFTGTISIFEPQPRAFISFTDNDDE